MMLIEVELKNRINVLRTILIETAEEKGLNNFETLSCSKKLDELIIVYQKQFQYTSHKSQEKCN